MMKLRALIRSGFLTIMADARHWQNWDWKRENLEDVFLRPFLGGIKLQKELEA
jgi:hypothetical protein